MLVFTSISAVAGSDSQSARVLHNQFYAISSVALISRCFNLHKHRRALRDWCYSDWRNSFQNILILSEALHFQAQRNAECITCMSLHEERLRGKNDQIHYVSSKSTCQHSLWTKFMSEFLVKPGSTLNCFHLHLYFRILERFIHMHHVHSWESHAYKTHHHTHSVSSYTSQQCICVLTWRQCCPAHLGKVTVKICQSHCGLGLAHNHHLPYSQNCPSTCLHHIQTSLSAWTVKHSVLPDMLSFPLGPQDIIIDESIRKSGTLQWMQGREEKMKSG